MDKKSKVLVVVCFAAGALACGLVFIGMRYQNTSSRRPTGEGTVSEDHAQTEKAENEVLQGALEYVGTHPKYKSKYYETGYPDDGYGVCTDVVAFAMKHAGFDLMEDVQRDIAEHPDAYGIEEPDPKIDFRRVRNLKVYFKHAFDSLATDLSDTGQWQGGDIVIFSNHVGVVSDIRNKRGVPYVIHHESPVQSRYEQDILEGRDDIVGHYRVME